MFQVTQYKTFQILVQTFPEPWARGSPSVFHFRNRQRFQVPGFEWVHELLLFCLASNPAQFCAEISCGKTELEHNCTISISRMKNDFSVCRRGASGGGDPGTSQFSSCSDLPPASLHYAGRMRHALCREFLLCLLILPVCRYDVVLPCVYTSLAQGGERR